MSTKKDKFSLKEKKYMRIAINLAKTRKGLTGNNPSVGCIIVKNDKIISLGVTGLNGRPHAETNAINSSYEDLRGAHMYVSLEPCCHYGKTPPCTVSIIKSGIKKLYFSINDIDSKVKGKSFKILSKRNIKVKKNLLKNEAKNLYDSYIFNRKHKTPYVTAKIAISKNKLIYSEGTKRITDNTSDKLSHYLRFKNDAIMVSSKTLNIDDPKLNCRLEGYESFSPKRVILDRDLKIKLNTYIFKTTNKNNTIIFHNSLDNFKIKTLKKKGIILIKSKVDYKNKLNLRFALKKLYSLGVRSLLVEGGDKLTKNMLRNRLINQFYLFKSSKILPMNKNHINFTSDNILKYMYKIRSKISSKLAKDTITIYK